MGIFIVKPNELEAVAIATSTEETRYYLQGVNFERYAGIDGFSMAATDGHRMHTIRIENGPEVTESFILPNNDIKKILMLVKNARKLHQRDRRDLLVRIKTVSDRILNVKIGLFGSEDGKDKTKILTLTDSEFTTEAIDGTFPDIRRAMPASDGKLTALESVSFNPEYMADAGRAGVLLHGCKRTSKVRLTFKGGDGAPIEVETADGSRFLAVVMPMRF